MNNFIIRKAIPNDAYWIVFVNVHTWYTTYKWLIPEKVLQSRIESINERTEKTRQFIESGKKYLVAENPETNEIVWMLVYWPSRNKDYTSSGEIVAIYVLQEYQKLGIGKNLFITWIIELIKLWYKDMIVNVLEWNQTINFYKKYGGIVVWEKYEPFGGIILKENILFFNDIKSIK